MKFEARYRISMYLLLFLSALILNVDADASIDLGGSYLYYPKFYPMAMAVACVLAYFTVDRKPWLGIGPGTANLLGISSLLLVYVEYRLDEAQLVLACGHWLFYLTLVKIFRPKEPSDDWYLIVLGLMQVLVGCFLSQGDRVGILLVVWSILALWVLSLFYLQREALRSGIDPRGQTPRAGPTARDAAPEAGEDPYPGLFGVPFYISMARAAGMTLLLGLLIFLIMPRDEIRGQSSRGSAAPKSLTGFSEEVRLGQMGEILENEAVVFSAELSEDGSRFQPGDDELLWRGVSLTRYRGGRWRRERSEVQIGSPPAFRSVPGRVIEQRIRMEESAERVLFALRPILNVEVRPDGLIVMNSHDGTLVRDRGPGRNRLFNRGRNNGPLEYVVFSEADPSAIPVQLGENDVYTYFPNGYNLLEIPEELIPELREISDRVVAGIDPEDRVGMARALEAYLKGGEFSYSLQMIRSDPGLDPNLDFLKNTRRGHCEYFASALALLLRSQGIPSRIVNGFKGGDWNELSQRTIVRQKHAHSWVEAYMGATPSSDRLPLWMPLDPTPSAEREEQIARVSWLPQSLRQVLDFIRYLWVFYVAGFNADRQEQLIYQPVKNLVKEAREGFRIMQVALLDAYRWLTEFPSPGAFFSVRGFIVSCLAMLLLVGVAMLGRLAWRMMRRRLVGPDDLADDPSGALASYVRLIRLLGEMGLQRPATETPREFARRASVLLGDRVRDDSGRPLTDVPARVVEAFYRVRFGELPLGEEAMACLDAQLDALEGSLKPAAG